MYVLNIEFIISHAILIFNRKQNLNFFFLYLEHECN